MSSRQMMHTLSPDASSSGVALGYLEADMNQALNMQLENYGLDTGKG